tara:strand:+ start:130 stop:945 length:816 start_codon:yes stop_codon:yes gene_type:complete
MAKAVAEKKRPEVAVATRPEANMLKMFEASSSEGLENLSQDDLALPFIKILSGLDPILDEREDARKGDLFNTVTGEVYKGKEGIRVVPCAYQKRFIQWSPRGQGTGAPVNIFTPAEALPKTERSSDDNKEYVVGGDGDYIDETHQHFVLVLHDDGSAETALIAMKSTQLKKSRKWNSMVASVQLKGPNGNVFTPPRFSHVYHMKSTSEENSKGSWHGWEISRDSLVETEEVFRRAKDFHDTIMAGEVVVKHEGESAAGAGVADLPNDDIPF